MHMTTEEIVELAQKHTDYLAESEYVSDLRDYHSALVCLADARYALRHGNDALARLRATKSLAYSVGIFHEDYCRAIE